MDNYHHLEFVKFLQEKAAKGPFKDNIIIPYEKLSGYKAIGAYFPYMLYWPEVKYLHLGSEIKSLLGYDPQHFTNDIENLLKVTRSDDVPLVIKMVKKMIGFLKDLPIKERHNITAAFDYRLKCEDGYYKRFLQQVLLLNLDESGAIIYEIGLLVDITRFRKNNPLSLTITNTAGKQLLYYVPEKDNSFNHRKFTQRELEIIDCLKKGLTSQEISEELYLSHYTVKTHRKNVLKKIGAHNTVELLTYCRQL